MRATPPTPPPAGRARGFVRRWCSPAWSRSTSWSKRAVEHSIVPGEEHKFLPGVQLVNTRNHGVAFGFLPGSHLGVTILISLALLALLAYFARHATRPLIWLPTGMLVGRRARQHPRPPAPRLGHRLRQAAARLAAVQPRRRLDHARHTDPVRAHRPLAPRRPLIGSPPVRAGFTIAFQDEHLIVVDKGPGVVVHPARGHREDTLAQLLAPLLAGGEEDRAGIVHRLDRDTSGLLVLARSRRGPPPAAGGARGAADRARVPRAGRGTPAGAHGHDRGADRARSRACARAWPSAAPARGRRARTSRSSARSRSTSLLRLRLETGRTHQIRVHLRAIGHPVCGDPEYGTPGLLGLERQFLHATRLAFEHPLDGRARRGQLAAARRPPERAGSRGQRRRSRGRVS